MVDLTHYCGKIQHAKKDGDREKADCRAILFDRNDDGFVGFLDKRIYGQVSQVDYIEKIESGVILIELRDLAEKLVHTSVADILKNLTKKYNHSISIIRNNIDINCIPVSYYIVVKNNTDILILDNLFPIREVKKNFSFNSRDSFIVCKTDEICEKLSALDIRLCHE